MRPDVGPQQVPQLQARAKCDLALPDPFQNAIAPLPLGNEVKILVNKVDGEIHLAAVGLQVLAKTFQRRQWNHVVGVDQIVGHSDHAIQPLYLRTGADQQRRQLVRRLARQLNEPAISYDIHKVDSIPLIDNWVAKLKPYPRDATQSHVVSERVQPAGLKTILQDLS